MTDKHKHSPIPWHWELDHIKDGWEAQYTASELRRMDKEDWKCGRIAIRNDKGDTILKGWGGDGDEGLIISDEDAHHICHCVNMHDELVEALKKLYYNSAIDTDQETIYLVEDVLRKAGE